MPKYYTKTDIKWLYYLLGVNADIICSINPDSTIFKYYIRYIINGIPCYVDFPQRNFNLLANKKIIIANGGNIHEKGIWRYLRYYVPNPDVVFEEVNKQMKGKFDYVR